MVVVSSYLIDQGAALEALRSAAQRNCRVYVVSASEEQLRLGRTYLSSEERLKVESYAALLKDLSTFAMVRSGDGIHAKAVLALGSEQVEGDRRSRAASGLLMTANLRDGALERNAELAIRLDGREAWDLFEALRYAFFVSASHEYEDGLLRSISDAAQLSEPYLATLWLRIKSRDDVETELARKVDESSGEVLAMSHSWSVDHAVTQSLMKAAADPERSVTVIANTQVRSSLPHLRAMAHAGIEVLGRPNSHAKAVVTESSVCVSTANLKRFDRTPSSFDLGLEVPNSQAEHVRSIVRQWAKTAPFELDPSQHNGDLPMAEFHEPDSSRPRRRLRNFGGFRFRTG